MTMIRTSLFLLLCGLFTTLGVSIAGATEPLNYDDNNNWASRPAEADRSVDIFYVHPTIYSGGENMAKNMDVNDKELRSVVQGLMKAQAGVYSPHGNLFAPYYRQQSGHEQDIYTASGKTSNGATSIFDDVCFQMGAEDVRHAFAYYLEKLNPKPRRPFIIAGHSQGTMTLINLMRKDFNDPDLQRLMVAAYLIGYSVTDNDLNNYPWMKLAQGPSDTGVIITYNTEAPGAKDSPVYVKGAKAINPLNWCTDSTIADSSQNMGAVFFDDGKGNILAEEPHFCAAQVDTVKGVLLAIDMKTTTKYGIDSPSRFGEGVYHCFDYAFWWKNLEQNVGVRINSYLKKTK